jgi:DNA repair exonuclease SbcCD ATPase subunit/predicted phosphodiesterase
MSLISIFSDPHLHNWNKFAKIKDGWNTRLLDTSKAMTQINDYNKEHDIETTICAGDLFHTFSYIENDVLNLAQLILKNWHGSFIFIAGNHDLKARAQYGYKDVGSAVFDDLKSTVRYLDDATASANGVNIYGLGWRKPQNFKDAKFEKADIGVFHQFIANASIRGGMEVPDDLIDKYKLLIFGDVHTFEHRGKLLIPGSITQQTFNDEGVEKYFHVYDTETDKLESIPINAPKFITVVDIGEVKDKENYYRVRNPIKRTDKTPENAIAHEEIEKQEFRSSGLTIGLTDEDMVEKYCEICEVKSSDIKAVGKDILSKCESKAIVPKNYVIKQVRLKNFCSFQGEHLFLFTNGIWLVMGKNGAGKTTVFEAVYWCKFGITTKKMEVEDIVNDVVGKDCAVVTLLESDEDIIVVNRFRKHTEYKDEFWFTIEDKKSGVVQTIQRRSKEETLRELLKLIGTDESFFKNVNYFSQENFEFFSTLTDSKQKALCKNLLQLDKNEEALERAKKLHKSASDDYTKCDGEKSILAARAAEKERSLEELEFAKTKYEQDRKDMIAEFMRTFNEASKKYDEGLVKIGSLNSTIRKLHQKYDEMTQIVAVDTVKFDSEIETIQIALRSLQELHNKESSTKKAVEDTWNEYSRTHDSNMNQYKFDVAQLDNRIENDGKMIADNEVKMEEAEKGICSECKRKLPVEQIKKQVKIYADMIKVHKERQDEAEKTKERIGFNVQDIEKEFEKVKSAFENEHEANEKALKGVDVKILDCEKKLSAVETARKNFIEAAKKLSDADVEILKTQISGISKEVSIRKEEIAQAERIMDEQKRKENETKNIVNPYIQRVADLGMELSKDNKELQSQSELLEKHSRDMDVYNFWITGFGNQGITSYLLDGFAEQFTTIINEVLLDISNGQYYAVLQTQKQLKSGEFREKFSFTIYIDSRKRSYNALSGGQKARVNLATVLTLNRLVKQYYGLTFHPFGILILDELFTYLDNEGVEAVMDALKKFAEDNAVFVITNKISVQALFERCIRVLLDMEHGSKIEIVKE